MTVKEFVEKYKENSNAEIVENIIKCNYLSFVKKCNLCERIIKSTYYTKNEDGSSRLYIDSASKYMLFNLSIIDTYTEITVDFGNVVEEYDLLAENDLFNIIKGLLKSSELGELEFILEMKERDVIQNEYEIHTFISNQVERFGNLLGISLFPVLEKLAGEIENLDVEKVVKILEQADKVDKSKVVKLFK